MRVVVIHYEMNIQVIRNLSVNTFEKVQKFRGTVTFVVFADHRARRDVEGCKKRRLVVSKVSIGCVLPARQCMGRTGCSRPSVWNWHCIVDA